MWRLVTLIQIRLILGKVTLFLLYFIFQNIRFSDMTQPGTDNFCWLVPSEIFFFSFPRTSRTLLKNSLHHPKFLGLSFRLLNRLRIQKFLRGEQKDRKSPFSCSFSLKLCITDEESAGFFFPRRSFCLIDASHSSVFELHSQSVWTPEWKLWGSSLYF